MDADAHSSFFGDGNDLFDEVRVVVPELFLGELTAMGERAIERLIQPVALGVLLMKRARRGATASLLLG